MRNKNSLVISIMMMTSLQIHPWAKNQDCQHGNASGSGCCKMLLALIFSGHPHFAHLATSMHFQHEWHRSKKQEGRGWGGGWPQKWHSLEMVEDFKTVRHVGGMKGWYWQRCTLDTNRLHLSPKKSSNYLLPHKAGQRRRSDKQLDRWHL